MTDTESKAFGARETISNYLLEQILGPTESGMFSGNPLPDAGPDGKIRFKKSESKGKFHDPETGFPILQNTRPEMAYGTGILHSPFEQHDKDSDAEEPSLEAFPGENDAFKAPEVPELKSRIIEDPSEENFGLDKSQKIRPSAMGLTAQFIPGSETEFVFRISAATYDSVGVITEEYGQKTWYRRVVHEETISMLWSELSLSPNSLKKTALQGVLGEYAVLQIRWRETSSSDSTNQSLFALTAVVSHLGTAKDDLFQFELTVEMKNAGFFASADKTKSLQREDKEEQEIEFLYRHVDSFAIGHGISVKWDKNSDGTVTKVATDSVPVFHQEVLETSVDGLSIKMMDLHDGSAENIKKMLQGLVLSYRDWIGDSREAFTGLPEHQGNIGNRLASKAENIAHRMQRGLDVLFAPKNEKVLTAFRLANKAMYLQQRHGKISRRTFSDQKGMPITFKELKYPNETEYGTWRPFQIGFLLMVLPGLVDPLDDSREEVDLIFFPTGGGKTEAYLGAAALTILFRRLDDVNHQGVDVLMRYTLRLLTVQQFERSSGLIVALEHLRRKSPELLGDNPISIGVWLGNKTTKNRRVDAVALLEDRSNKDESNPFVLSKCPWCGAAFERRESNKTWVGYKRSADKPFTLTFQCGDETCEFSRPSTALPIWITDEDVYDLKPSFVLGTVDKFAQIAWQPKSRALFNIGPDGEREGLPPSLIIQDELHLISGPLGSMVGLYETVIEELCSYSIGSKRVGAKIIASTATTRRYEQQIFALYGRHKVTLFPQAITRANETFFARVKTENGIPVKGTQYLGINPATYATGQLAASQVGAFLSQAPNAWTGSKEEIDFYSTSMWFFNSLKELGQTLTLMQSTVVSLLNSMWRDSRLPSEKQRYLDPIMELTGRISSAQVNKSLGDLSIPSWEKGAINTCLASSIMEVGVDVQRLGLLTIMGQPKLTAQYIQVSGRVGRAGSVGPGLVVMLYNSGRARDRSVYEHFPSFHNKLYAQVEPLSVTPFAIQTMEKGLAGAMIALYRMLGPVGMSPTHLDEELYETAAEVFRKRITLLNSSNARIEDFEKQVRDLKARWLLYEPTKWEYDMDQEMGKSDNPDTALLRRKIEKLTHMPGDSSIAIPQSMRNVDGQTDIIQAANPYNFLPSRDGESNGS